VAVEDRSIRLETDLPVSLADQFKAAARSADRSPRAQLRHLIKVHLAETSETQTARPGSRETTAAGSAVDVRSA
jgi:hypothetical protein